MAIFIPWLADAAKATGYPVIEEKGWKTRGTNGYGMAMVEGVAGHHTAGPKTGEYPCRNIILNGRKGLSGPLAHYGLGRSGSIYVVAAGRANHAGESYWAGYTNLNNKFIGIEAEDDGDGHWTHQQLDCYPRLVAACLYYMRRGPERYAAHRDIAPGRKPDPAGIDSNWMRSKVGVYLRNPATIHKGYQAGEEEEIVFRAVYDINNKRIGLVGPNYFKTVNDDLFQAAAAAGACNVVPDEINAVEWDRLRYTALSSENL